jgi:FeS assembly SUF system protein
MMAQTEKTKSLIPMSDHAAGLEEKVIEKLRTVFDPEIPVNIYDLGLIYDIQFCPALEDRLFDAHIKMTLTTPNCPVAEQMPAMVERAVKDVPELRKVKVELTFDPPWDKSRMTDEAKLQLNMF